MHGRHRAEYKALQRENAGKLAQKASQWYTLTENLRDRRVRKDLSETTLALTEKLLTVNPDPLYLWNHRREWLLSTAVGTASDPVQRWQPELDLTLTALQNNPKAYGAWFHRKWTLLQILQSESSRGLIDPSVYMAVLESELDLVAELLKADERNFHGWNYRRFVVSCQLHIVTAEYGGGTSFDVDASEDWPVELVPDGSWPSYVSTLPDVSDQGKPSLPDRQLNSSFSMGPQIAIQRHKSKIAGSQQIQLLPQVKHVLQQEWNFSLSKIMENFSNFSAFHYRSKLLPLMVEVTCSDNGRDKGEILADMIPTELEMVENAVFTEPDE